MKTGCALIISLGWLKKRESIQSYSTGYYYYTSRNQGPNNFTHANSEVPSPLRLHCNWHSRSRSFPDLWKKLWDQSNNQTFPQKRIQHVNVLPSLDCFFLLKLFISFVYIYIYITLYNVHFPATSSYLPLYVSLDMLEYPPVIDDAREAYVQLSFRLEPTNQPLRLRLLTNVRDVCTTCFADSGWRMS